MAMKVIHSAVWGRKAQDGKYVVGTLLTPCVCRTKERVGEPTAHTWGQHKTASPALRLSPSAPGQSCPLPWALLHPQSTAPFSTLHHRVQSLRERAPALFLSPPAVWGTTVGEGFPPPRESHCSGGAEGKVHCVEYKTDTAYPR